MGLGGVAIAVPPYVIHPKMAVLGRAGGGIPHTALQLNVSEVRIHPGKLSGATSSSKIEEVNLVYLKR